MNLQEIETKQAFQFTDQFDIFFYVKLSNVDADNNDAEILGLNLVTLELVKWKDGLKEVKLVKFIPIALGEDDHTILKEIILLEGEEECEFSRVARLLKDAIWERMLYILT